MTHQHPASVHCNPTLVKTNTEADPVNSGALARDEFSRDEVLSFTISRIRFLRFFLITTLYPIHVAATYPLEEMRDVLEVTDNSRNLSAMKPRVH